MSFSLKVLDFDPPTNSSGYLSFNNIIKFIWKISASFTCIALKHCRARFLFDSKKLLIPILSCIQPFIRIHKNWCQIFKYSGIYLNFFDSRAPDSWAWGPVVRNPNVRSQKVECGQLGPGSNLPRSCGNWMGSWQIGSRRVGPRPKKWQLGPNLPRTLFSKF